MDRKIFIPETCRAGFQKREGTFDGKLGYVIYYDAFGKLRKETSWEHWRHKDVEPFDFKNVPTSGFVLNKGIRRFCWSHFGTGRSMIRIYDPRGIEFEVTPENLIGLLMHTDCSKREVQGDLVYAWIGTELMLMPCASEEYEAAKNFTKLQAKKVKASELQEGFTYVTKQEEQLVYLGRHMWHEFEGYYSKKKGRNGAKQHVFCNPEGKDFKYITSIPSKIAAVLSEHCHDQFSNWVEAFLKTPWAAKLVGWKRKPLSDNWWLRDWTDQWGGRSRNEAYVELRGEVYAVNIRMEYPWGYHNPADIKGKPLILCYDIGVKVNKDGSSSYDHRGEERKVEDRSIFFDLFAVYDNGTEQEWRT